MRPSPAATRRVQWTSIALPHTAGLPQGGRSSLQHTDGILEAPKIVWLGLTRVRHVNNAIRDVFEVIDEPLARLISPEDRSFTLEHLVEHHGYPTDDLDQIDWEWR